MNYFSNAEWGNEMRRAVAGCVGLVLMLGACAGGPPEKGGSFKTVEDLRDAYVKTGRDCSAWKHEDKMKAAAQSAECDSSTVLSTYLSQSQLEEAIRGVKEFNDKLDLGSDEWLVGENWIINAKDVAELQKKMGGTVVGT